jgi:hypothetical protein
VLSNTAVKGTKCMLNTSIYLVVKVLNCFRQFHTLAIRGPLTAAKVGFDPREWHKGRVFSDSYFCFPFKVRIYLLPLMKCVTVSTTNPTHTVWK